MATLEDNTDYGALERRGLFSNLTSLSHMAPNSDP